MDLNKSQLPDYVLLLLFALLVAVSVVTLLYIRLKPQDVEKVRVRVLSMLFLAGGIVAYYLIRFMVGAV